MNYDESGWREVLVSWAILSLVLLVVFLAAVILGL